MRLRFFVVFLTLILTGCNQDNRKHIAKKDNSLIHYVNPFIGTGGHGHTYPGATSRLA